MKRAFLLLLMVLIYSGVNAQTEPSIPHLKKQGNSFQLIVDGKPIVLLTAELSNSAGSSMDYMEPIWPKLKKHNLNAVIASVTWEMIEPVEGQFDFTSLDALVKKSGENDMKLVLLWFGSWKNAGSSYPPAWVRQNTKLYPRRQTPTGENTNGLGCFTEPSWNADARAFAAVMKHLKEIDGTQQTVVAVQVENEPGVRGFTRDFSPLANKLFAQAVPKTLISFLQNNKAQLIPEFDAIWKSSNYKTSGNWSEVFGEYADEVFMAWYIASYIDKVAAAGKKEYPLPMYANSWLPGTDNQKAGVYPSGGPVAKMVPVYQAAAPHLDFLSPDIYRSDFANVCNLFKRMDNALFIPETRLDATMTSNVFYAVGEGALCYSPFGIDKKLPVIDSTTLFKSYRVLTDLMPLITQYQGSGKMKGILVPSGETQTIEMGDYQLMIEAAKGRKLPAYGLIIAKEKDEYLVTGDGFSVKFISKSKSFPHAEILWAYELVYKNNQWLRQRRMNGDETGVGSSHNIELRFVYDEPRVLTAKIFSYD